MPGRAEVDDRELCVVALALGARRLDEWAPTPRANSARDAARSQLDRLHLEELLEPVLSELTAVP